MIEKSIEFAKLKNDSPFTFKPKFLANILNKTASQLLDVDLRSFSISWDLRSKRSKYNRSNQLVIVKSSTELKSFSQLIHLLDFENNF